jgi:hypothetical protein
MLGALKSDRDRRSKRKTHDGDPEPNISFGQLIADEEFLALEHLFDPAQGLKY